MRATFSTPPIDPNRPNPKSIEMNFLIILLVTFLVPMAAQAQIGINTSAPDASSSLDIQSSDSGLLIPRVSLLSIFNAANPVNAPAASLMVYNTNNAVVGGSGSGYYYWDGTQWTKLVTVFDEKWTRNAATGSLFPATLSDNVGIGTNTPNAPLAFPSAIGHKITLYAGVSGNYGFGIAGGLLKIQTDAAAADIGFGYDVGGTLIERMRIKGNGNVGIGTSAPVQKLDIAGKIKITDGSQANGRILVSDADGVGTWTNNIAITPAVVGVFASNGATFGNGYGAGITTPNFYCNAYIDLPPGKWMVFGTYLLNGYLAADASVFVRTSFSCSNVAYTGCDIVTGALISGVLTGPSQFGLANGQTVLNNASGATKRYYLWASIIKYGTTPSTFNILQLGGNFWAENMLTAIPMN